MFLALLKILATNFIFLHEKNMETECPLTSKSLGHIISKQAPGRNELLG